MQSLVILGIIFFATLASVIFLILIVWQRANLYFTFGINPDKYLAFIIRSFVPVRESCVSIQKDDWELLAYKSETTKLKPAVNGFKTGHIQNIYGENIIAYGFYPANSKNAIAIMGTKEQFCLFKKYKDGRYSVYWNNSSIYGYINSNLELVRNNTTTAKIIPQNEKAFTSLIVSDVEYATINEWKETESKIPQRFFDIIKDLPSTATNDFRILIYFKMLNWLIR